MVTGLLTPTHVAILLAIALLIFGPKRLPQTGRALGRTIREFRQGIAAHAEALDAAPAEPPIDEDHDISLPSTLRPGG